MRESDSRRLPPLPAHGVPRTVRLALASLLLAHAAVAFPLDALARTGIRRLEGYRLRQQASGGSKLPPGALLGDADIRLHLTAVPEADLLGRPKHLGLQAALETMFARRDPSYSVAVVDITDPENLAWAGLREDRLQTPGSLGKIGVLVGLFDALRRAFPEPAVRERILRMRSITATDWAVGDSHTVPKYDAAARVNRHSILHKGETYTLSEWVDHMCSASANSAASVVWKEAMLLRQFGAAYPPSAAEEAAFLKGHTGKQLTDLSLAVIEEPLKAAGIRTEGFRQGTMFTRVARQTVPGTGSHASPFELARMMLRLEQGRLVDAWSSLEMKKYLYLTKRRYRYTYAPELRNAACYFKSGSIYSCRSEPGFHCVQFEGNNRNLMNSVCIVESPAAPGPGQRRYLVALMSNVLKVNSAWDHSRIAAAIDAAIHSRQAVEIRDEGSAEDKEDSGRSH